MLSLTGLLGVRRGCLTKHCLTSYFRCQNTMDKATITLDRNYIQPPSSTYNKPTLCNDDNTEVFRDVVLSHSHLIVMSYSDARLGEQSFFTQYEKHP